MSVASFLKGLGPLDGLGRDLVVFKFMLEDKARAVGKLAGVDFSVFIALDEKLQDADSDDDAVDSGVGGTMDGNDVTDGCVGVHDDDGVDNGLDGILDPDRDEDATDDGERGVMSGMGTSVDSTRGVTSMW